MVRFLDNYIVTLELSVLINLGRRAGEGGGGAKCQHVISENVNTGFQDKLEAPPSTVTVPQAFDLTSISYQVVLSGRMNGNLSPIPGFK